MWLRPAEHLQLSYYAVCCACTVTDVLLYRDIPLVLPLRSTMTHFYWDVLFFVWHHMADWPCGISPFVYVSLDQAPEIRLSSKAVLRGIQSWTAPFDSPSATCLRWLDSETFRPPGTNGTEASSEPVCRDVVLNSVLTCCMCQVSHNWSLLQLHDYYILLDWSGTNVQNNGQHTSSSPK